jgi:hypothetical protein
LPPRSRHILTWNKNHKPLIYIDSGSKVTIDNFEAEFKNITRDITDTDLAKFNIQGLQGLEKLMAPYTSMAQSSSTALNQATP